ncbi:peptidase M20C, Xaa-His dipeptidase [Kipferlia bialata]|uniref:Peptidase M20C, Xaa-His dipeptidase n=1 Tax=Kipferlia bialata TaxID=797122 RepID=A0A9K3CP28_9EUKA|nr:peptidase M20C, Xaa-His dipeptidase [Kipferlia bialata]|eukprot:g384.t1
MDLITDACKNLLPQLPGNEAVWKIFLRMLEIPNGSGHHAKIMPGMIAMIEEMGLEYEVDTAKNIIVRSVATPGFEDVPGVCFQGHSDMVCVSKAGKVMDFINDPIEPRLAEIDGKTWMLATDTSLGADNGIGIALGLAIMTDPTVARPACECLITCDEEIGLIGASALAPNCLRSKYLINVDSEDAGVVTVSCAGGFVTKYALKAEASPCETTTYRAEISGLAGGHTGVEIHKLRGNSLKIMATCLTTAVPGCRILSMQGGQAHNAIPRACVVEFTSDKENVEAAMQAAFANAVAPHKETDPGATLTVTGTNHGAAYSAEVSASLLGLLLALPHGPKTMSADVEGLVQTSFATATLATANGFHIVTSGRSSVESDLDTLYAEVKATGEKFGFDVSAALDRYPGWAPNMESALLKELIKAHEEEFGRKPTIEAIHAGLEAGIILKCCPNMEAVSIGPTIVSPHSDTERLLIEDIPYCYSWMVKYLAGMKH